MIRKLYVETYSPLYFLAALGAGGLVVTFFMYLMFMIDHPDTPMVTFNHIYPLLQQGGPLIQGLIGAALVAMLLLAVLHFRLLFWNIAQYRRFRHTPEFLRLKQSNAEVSLMAIPLTLAMTINVAFVLGAVFVPNLWLVVEYLFPLAILSFLAVGAYALRIFGVYLMRLIEDGDFDFVDNANLSQMLAIFAFAMIAVGFAAPGAMSHVVATNAVGLFLSIFFISLVVLLGTLKLVLGFKSILMQGIAAPATPSLWIMIPILTLLGITVIRQSFGLQHGFNDEPFSMPEMFVLTSAILSLQILFGLVGYGVMKRVGYFRDYVRGDKRHPGSYSLVCPGVAFFVFGMFFIVFGLVKNGLVERFSLAYFLILAPLVWIQFKTLVTFIRLNRKLLFRPRGAAQGRLVAG